SPADVFNIFHQSVNVPPVDYGLQPKYIPLQLIFVEHDILTLLLQLSPFGQILDIRNPLSVSLKSGDLQIENYCAVGPSLSIMPTVHQHSITPLCYSGSTPKNIQHDSLVAFAFQQLDALLLLKAEKTDITDAYFKTDNDALQLMKANVDWNTAGKLKA
ncbi:MAG: hypothetical protein EZS28_043943, partial [Streblomastix strix]